MANDSHNFWSIFEEAKQKVQEWPDWKQEIRVSINSEEPPATCAPPGDETDQSSK